MFGSQAADDIYEKSPQNSPQTRSPPAAPRGALGLFGFECHIYDTVRHANIRKEKAFGSMLFNQSIYQIFLCGKASRQTDNAGLRGVGTFACRTLALVFNMGVQEAAGAPNSLSHRHLRCRNDSFHNTCWMKLI
ncbi:hypothetical protein EYF80_021227 [Liparis tanakae]|uniref:Uncharacterized protein n=1 Tax=Liparis tanakae TaxID=230148 RepID=A0A4Z2HSQ4_9TELE|nr:hypothetical protein EYF80_021227 [Liparis tanakae]